MEVLSPAGSLAKLKVAVRYGADAVYMALKRFGLRSFSENFTHEEFIEGVNFAHAHGVKCYVTLNILATETDLATIDEEIRFLSDNGADAVLVSDPGIFDRVRTVAPDLDIHISTQASVTNSGAVNFWAKQGATRIVLAREVSLEDIKRIRDNIPPEVELEAFVHGAMCVAYSGRCLLSNYFTGRRSNGGACAQPCRWEYDVFVSEKKRPDLLMPVEEDERGTYVFGSKDLCMVDYIPALAKAGVDSLKIEGRIKGEYYLAASTKVYREAVDLYDKAGEEGFAVDPRWTSLLDKVVHRDYSTGFFFNSPMEDANIDETKSYNKPAFLVGMIEDYDEARGMYKVIQKNKLFEGDVLNVLMPEGYVEPVKAVRLEDDKGQHIESTPHPEMTFYMETDNKDVRIPRMSFLSRDGDKDQGITKQNT